MAERRPSPLKPARAEGAGTHSAIKPLTRGSLRRLAVTEQQILAALPLDTEGLLSRAQERDTASSDYMSPEALVHFIRRADGAGDIKQRDGLFRELLDR